MPRKITILHNEVGENSAAEVRDVISQVEVVETALHSLGWHTNRLACTLNLHATMLELQRARPEVVFNLVESLGGSDALASAAAGLLETLNLPFTGSSSNGLVLTNDKLLTKHWLPADIRRPGWMVSLGKAEEGDCDILKSTRTGGLELVDEHATDRKYANRPVKFVLKAVREHASIGMDDNSIISVTDAFELEKKLRSWTKKNSRPGFAEQFIAGREFNVSLLADPINGVQVLPAAEIDFSRFPADKPRIVGYDAKWTEDSFEFLHTPRTFDFPESDGPLLAELGQIATKCWHAFDLRGYVRVDFRVDEQNQPWVLEINANPCLSPDGGFAAAVQRAGLDFATAIDRIVQDALR